MRKTKILYLIAFLSLQIVFFNGFLESNTVYAQTQESQVMSTDVIIKKTRYHDGKWQYRRWNDTKCYWVDPYWIDM